MSQKLDTSPAVIGIDIGKNSFHIIGQNQHAPWGPHVRFRQLRTCRRTRLGQLGPRTWRQRRERRPVIRSQ